MSHTHRWKPGPLIEGWSPSHTGGSSSPTTIILVCKCGRLWRQAVPYTIGRRPADDAENGDAEPAA